MEMLTTFGIPFEVRILSAHRTPEAVLELRGWQHFWIPPCQWRRWPPAHPRASARWKAKNPDRRRLRFPWEPVLDNDQDVQVEPVPVIEEFTGMDEQALDAAGVDFIRHLQVFQLAGLSHVLAHDCCPRLLFLWQPDRPAHHLRGGNL